MAPRVAPSLPRRVSHKPFFEIRGDTRIDARIFTEQQIHTPHGIIVSAYKAFPRYPLVRDATLLCIK